MVYNIFFHPLRKITGPLWQRASAVPWAIQTVKGTQQFRTKEFHDQYGPVVRIGPNHLSFTDGRAFQDIYGHRIGRDKDKDEMHKSPLFFDPPFPEFSDSIANSNREKHAKIRRALAHSFSEKELRKQEEIILRYLRKLINGLREYSQKGPLDIESWINYSSFDIVGDLAMNLKFECIENAEYVPLPSSCLQLFGNGANARQVSMSPSQPFLKPYLQVSSPLHFATLASGRS